MDDQEFLSRIKEKIERLSGTEIRINLDAVDQDASRVDLDGHIPEVTLGSNVLRYSGFVRMCIEYAVASIRERRKLGNL